MTALGVGVRGRTLRGRDRRRALRALRVEAEARNDPVTSVEGVGGPAMLAAGLRASLFPMEDVSVMGVAEVAASLPSLRRRLSQAAAAVNAAQPDVLLTIDAKGFSFRLAKAVTNEGTTKVHVVSPSWWAWRGGERNLRALRVAGIDAVACLLPFEPEGVRRAGPLRSWATPWWRTSGKARGVSRGSGGAPRRRGEGGDRDDRPRRVAGEPRPGTRQTPAAVSGSLRGAFEAVANARAASRRKKRTRARLANANAARRVPGAPAPPTQGAPRTRDVAGSRDGDPADAGDCQTRASFFGATDAALVAAGTATAQAFAHGGPRVVAYAPPPPSGSRALAKAPHASLPNVALPALAPVPEYSERLARRRRRWRTPRRGSCATSARARADRARRVPGRAHPARRVRRGGGAEPRRGARRARRRRGKTE